MNKMIFLVLFISQLFLFKCSYQINLITSYKFGSGNYLFYFDNGLYDYYVFGNLINTNKKINFKFCYEQSTLYVYSYSSKVQMDKASIQNTLDFFKMVYLYREYNGNEYCYSFEYKKNSNDNDYFYIAIHLSDQATFTKYAISLNSYIGENVKLITSYKFGSGESFLDFDNSEYDYYILGNLIDTNDRIHFNFYHTSNNLSLSTYVNGTSMDRYDIQNNIKLFEKQILKKDYCNDDGWQFSFDFKKTGNTECYCYIAINLPDSASTYSHKIKIDSYTESSRLIRVGIIILIIIAVLVGLAFASMGTAKYMGRSPLDGLLGFFILCALCCCRNR